MRMHGIALRMLMSNDVRQVCGWLGYKRGVQYARMRQEENSEEENYFDLGEQVGQEESELLNYLKKIIKLNAEDKEQRIAE